MHVSVDNRIMSSMYVHCTFDDGLRELESVPQGFHLGKKRQHLGWWVLQTAYMR